MVAALRPRNGAVPALTALAALAASFLAAAGPAIPQAFG